MWQNKNKSAIFTEGEMKVIERKLNGRKLSQTDSNYLTRFVRPKLREIGSIDAKKMLEKLEYCQKARKIKRIIVENITKSLAEVSAIILFGSVIQNNYHNYNDVDIMVITEKEIYKKMMGKIRKIKELKILLQKKGIKPDIQIYDKKTLKQAYSRSPGLVYQLKDYEIIYGRMNIKRKIQMYNIDLHMKLDWSDIFNTSPNGEEIYRALRNVVLVRLLLCGIVDNGALKESLNDEVGKNLAERLKNNQESKIDRKIALNLLKELMDNTRKSIKGGLWEKIRL